MEPRAPSPSKHVAADYGLPAQVECPFCHQHEHT